ncbi:MAG: AAC(3) family N-acetyltransferase [Acutalibacteraceae bacterium]
MLVHSSLRSLGAPLQDGASGLVQQLMEQLGPQGTLVLPTLRSDLSPLQLLSDRNSALS